MRAWSGFPTRKVLSWWTLGNIIVSDDGSSTFVVLT
jgi:hypothetical protein